MIETVIETLPDPDSMDEVTGMVTVTYADGATMVGLDVMDTEGSQTRVHLNFVQVSHLMVALGNAASNL